MNEISTDNLGEIYQQPLAQQIMENAFLGFIGNLDAYMKAKVHVAEARTKHEKEQAEIARKNAAQKLQASNQLLQQKRIDQQIKEHDEKVKLAAEKKQELEDAIAEMQADPNIDDADKGLLEQIYRGGAGSKEAQTQLDAQRKERTKQSNLDALDDMDLPESQKQRIRIKIETGVDVGADDASAAEELQGLLDKWMPDPEDQKEFWDSYLKEKAGIKDPETDDKETPAEKSTIYKDLAGIDLSVQEGRLTPEQGLALIRDHQRKSKGDSSDEGPSETIESEDAWYAEGRLPPDKVKEIIAFRKDIQSSQNFRDLVKAKRALNVMADATEGDSPVSEIAVLYTFIRAIDPGSVVREGELHIFTAARGFMARIGELKEKADEGTALTEDEIREIATIAQSMTETYKEDYDAMEATVKAGLEAHGAYMRKDKNGDVIAMTDPKTFMQMASFEDVNVEAPDPSPETSDRRINVPDAVAGMKADGKTLEEVIEVVRTKYPDQLDEFIRAWIGVDNADN